MHTLAHRIAALERHGRQAQAGAPWVVPSREGIAFLLAAVLPGYADCGLLSGPPLDDAAITATLAAMPWPVATQEPASLQGHQVLQAALRRCGVSWGETL